MICSTGLVLALASAAEPIPLDAFAKLPTFADMQMSPDGQRIALLRPFNGLNGVTVLDLKSQTQSPTMAADESRFRIDGCQWANNDRLVCSIRTSATLSVGNQTPVRVAATALIAVNHDGSESLELMKDSRNNDRDRLRRDDLVSMLPNDRNHILVEMFDEKRMNELDRQAILKNISIYPDVYRLNIYDDSRTRELKAREGIGEWIADYQGNVVAGIGFGGDGYRAVSKSVDGRWISRDVSELGNDLETGVLHVNNAATIALVTARKGDRLALYEYDVAAEKLGRTVYAHDRFDFDGRVLSVQGEARGLMVIDDEYHFEPLTDDWRALKTNLSAALPNAAAIPWSWDSNGEKFVIRVFRSGLPSEWYYFDRPARQLARIESDYPALANAALPRPQWVEYPARDGTLIPALLTLPVGSVQRGLPTVLMPHGGPVSRDHSHFDFIAVFLASRGYAVLQPNFRGSSGYGKKWLRAGLAQWGGLMQDDVMDGLAHLRKEGIADPQRACIVGLSYGGYAALVAAYKTPAQLRCAVSYAGVSDLGYFMRNREGFESGNLTARYLNLSLRRDFLNENSPAQSASKFGVPTLIMHAQYDTNVLVEHSRTLADALKAAGKSNRYVEQPNGDHFLGVQTHRTQFLQELESFLSANLGTATAPASAADSGTAGSQ